MQAAHGNNACSSSSPLDIECRVKGTEAVYSSTNDVLEEACTVEEGIVCRSINQTDSNCEDYEVRFKCDVFSGWFMHLFCKIIAITLHIFCVSLQHLYINLNEPFFIS